MVQHDTDRDHPVEDSEEDEAVGVAVEEDMDIGHGRTQDQEAGRHVAAYHVRHTVGPLQEHLQGVVGTIGETLHQGEVVDVVDAEVEEVVEDEAQATARLEVGVREIAAGVGLAGKSCHCDHGEDIVAFVRHVIPPV